MSEPIPLTPFKTWPGNPEYEAILTWPFAQEPFYQGQVTRLLQNDIPFRFTHGIGMIWVYRDPDGKPSLDDPLTRYAELVSETRLAMVSWNWSYSGWTWRPDLFASVPDFLSRPGQIQPVHIDSQLEHGTSNDRYDFLFQLNPGPPMSTFEYVFPAIRGIQARREYYVSMCPLRLIPRIFLFDEEELRPELRAQRALNKARIPEMAGYLLGRPREYVFSALTASIDGPVAFEPLGKEEAERSVGRLRIAMKAKFVINDGQHRRAAIQAALAENPDLGDETIAIVFFLDVGLKRCQQMFADLNRYAVRPATSLSLLYDHHDSDALVAKGLLQRVPLFTDLTETQRSTISNRSIKLFTLSGIYHATQTLLVGHDEPFEKRLETAAAFWNEVARHVVDWNLARERKVSAAELRRDYIHAHTLALSALARAGHTLLAKHGNDWKQRLAPLKSLDWSRSNSKLWEGRAMSAGRLSKKTVNVVLTGNAIKKHLGLKLSPEEQQLETDYRKGRHGSS